MKAIETKKLTKVYGDLVAVDNLDLIVDEGEIFSLLGVNGAGKTTTIKMLTCLLEPTNGSALVLGNDIIKESSKVKNIIGVSPQETAIAPNLTVEENLMFIAELYEIKNVKEKVAEIVKSFSLEKNLKKRAGKLSGGYMRRLSIAMALIGEPKVIFLDEPTLGLDVLARKELWDIITELKKKMTIILTTHYMEEAEKLSDHIGIMADGKLLCQGTKEEIYNIGGSDNLEDAFVNIVSKVRKWEV